MSALLGGLCVAGLSLLPLTAAAGPGGRLPLRDGGRVRWVERIGAPPPAGLARGRTDLAEVRWAGARAWVGRRAVVALAPGADLDALGLRPVRPLMPARGLWLVEDRGGADGLDTALRLQRDPRFGRELIEAQPELFHEVRTAALLAPPDDPRYPGQWYLARIGMEAAWRLESGRPEVTVVVIDDGCDYAHPDLAAQLDRGRDVVDGDDDASYAPNQSGNNHGTACAGLVGAQANNATGIAGVCPGCRLRCVRLLSGPRSVISSAQEVEAFQFALDAGAAVVSNSWGYTRAIPAPAPVAAAIDELVRNGRGGRGALVLFAAGNDSRELLDDELTGLPGVLTIGAVNNFDEVTQFTNYGRSVAVVAPTGTLTTDISGPDGEDPGDYTSRFGGTSSACPIAAGIAGLLASAAPERSAAELADALVRTARQSPFARPDGSGHDPYYGRGLVDPAAALLAVGAREPDPPMMMGGGCSVAPGPRSGGGAIVFLLLALICRRRRAA
jgi:hypothetical protein